MKRKEIILSTALFLCLGILLCGRFLWEVLPTLAFVVLAEFYLYKNYASITSRLRRPHPVMLAAAFAVTVLLAYGFTVRWYRASPFLTFAALTHTDHNVDRRILGTVLGVLSYLPVLVFVDALQEQIKKDKDDIKLVLASFLELFAVEVSAIPLQSMITWDRFLVILVNFLFVLTFNLLLYVIFRRCRVAMIPSLLLFFAWSVADYYVIQYHGSPLFFSALMEAFTGLDVADSYSYSLAWPVVLSVAGILAAVYVVYPPRKIVVDRSDAPAGEESTAGEKKPSPKRKLTLHILFAAVLVAVDILGFIYLQSKYVIWLPWDHDLKKCGFFVTTFVDLKRTLFPLDVPESYASFDAGDYPASQPVETNGEQDYPDIILILNETFFDLHNYMELHPQPEPLTEFYGIPGAVYGKAVNPLVGGGTNNSEYELLSSKSIFLLNNVSPFSFLNSKRLSRTAVEYLNSLGYTTVGMHCCNGKNYNRNVAYPALGFDEVHLGEENYTFNNYGERKFLDKDNYQDMIGWYNELPEGPRFMYLLTFQNHGGFERNEPEFDTVHISDNFGEYTEMVNEYLTSVSMSASAFRELTEYYAQVDRRVIICMVGDHAPSIIPNLPESPKNRIKETTINQRSVPYVMWSNFGAGYDGYTEYASMVDLMPMTLKAAGLPLSGFYSEILALHELLPVRTSDGMYMDKKLRVGIYEPGDPNYELISRYYNLEYNSLLLNEDHCAELFEP